MSDGNRPLVVAAVFGLIVTSAGLGGWINSKWPYEPASYPGYYESVTQQSDATSIAPLQPSLNGVQEKQPCHNSRSRDESELCAQWRAAHAADRAADYAWWQIILSFLGVLGLGGTLAFNWVTIRMALKGQKDAERGLWASEKSAFASARAATAASESNQIARETMQRQLRPYVYLFDQRVSFGHIHSFEALDDSAEVTFSIQNFGQAPAKNVIFVAHVVIGEYWNQRIPEITAASLQTKAVVPLGDIPPQHIRNRPGYRVTGLVEAYRDIFSGMKSIFLEGQIRYTDDFGNPYFTNFQLAMSGIKHEEEPPAATPHWNDAS